MFFKLDQILSSTLLLALIFSCSDTEFSQDSSKKKKQKQVVNEESGDFKVDEDDARPTRINSGDPEEKEANVAKIEEPSEVAPYSSVNFGEDKELKKGLLSYTCDDLKDGIKFNGSRSEYGSYQIEGQLCFDAQPEVETQKLNVVFAIDLSGSMKDNDPLESGGCGRYEAVKGIADKLKASLNDYVKINVGIVGFNSKAYSLMVMQKLHSDLNFPKSEICRIEGNTSYKDAFEMSKSMLTYYEGRTIVFLISDGLPYVKGYSKEYTESEGIKAAQSLRDSNDKLKIFSVYIKGEQSGDPTQYLAQITGNPEYVKLVNKASDLAPEIKQFELPALDEGMEEPLIKIVADGFKEKNIQVLEFKKLDDNRWTFKSEYFTPYYGNEGLVENQISITPQTAAESKTIKAVLNYSNP